MTSMTIGEKMIWAAVYGAAFTSRDDAFKMRSNGQPIDVQREAWEDHCADWATEKASQAVDALRRSETESRRNNSGMAVAMRKDMLER